MEEMTLGTSFGIGLALGAAHVVLLVVIFVGSDSQLAGQWSRVNKRFWKQETETNNKRLK